MATGSTGSRPPWWSSRRTRPTTTPATGAELRSGTAADIRVPGQEDFRESTLVYQDGLNLRTTTGAQVPDHEVPDIGPDGELIFEPEPDGGDVQAGGTEDAGEKGVNYTNAPLHRRLGAAPGVLEGGCEQRRLGVGVLLGDPR